MPKVNGKPSKGRLTERLPKNVAVEPPPACKACMTHPCVCEQDAAEAKAQREADLALAAKGETLADKLENVAIETCRTHTLTGPEGHGQYDFHPRGETVAVVWTTKYACGRQEMPAEEARYLYRRLLKQGYKPW